MQITENMLRSDDDQDINEAMTKCLRKRENICQGHYCHEAGRCFTNLSGNVSSKFYNIDKTILQLKRDISDIENKYLGIDQRILELEDINKIAETIL